LEKAGMLMRLLKSVGCLILMFPLGCQIDDIAIEVFKEGDDIEFVLHHEGSEDPVDVIGIQVLDLVSGRIVWELGTVDLSGGDGRQGSGRVLKEPPHRSKLHTRTLSRLVFGRVPEGLIQYCPKPGEAPILDKDGKYEIFVYGGAHRGRREFEVALI
jgi:hypothetical protein